VQLGNVVLPLSRHDLPEFWAHNAPGQLSAHCKGCQMPVVQSLVEAAPEAPSTRDAISLLLQLLIS
jgi:hypothetical protein